MATHISDDSTLVRLNLLMLNVLYSTDY